MKKKIIPTKELLADMAALEIYGGIGSSGSTNANCANAQCKFGQCNFGSCNFSLCQDCLPTYTTQCTQPT